MNESVEFLRKIEEECDKGLLAGMVAAMCKKSGERVRTLVNGLLPQPDYELRLPAANQPDGPLLPQLLPLDCLTAVGSHQPN